MGKSILLARNPYLGTYLCTDHQIIRPPPPQPPPYDKQTTPVANNNPYPGYDPSRVRIAVTPLERLGDVPAHINCPFCNTISLTTVTKTDSSQTTCASLPFPLSLFTPSFILFADWLWNSVAAVLCCLCCGIITVCLPHWLGWYQNVEHRCGNCKRRVTYKPNDGAIQIETAGGLAQTPENQIPGAPQPVHKATWFFGHSSLFENYMHEGWA